MYPTGATADEAMTPVSRHPGYVGDVLFSRAHTPQKKTRHTHTLTYCSFAILIAHLVQEVVHDVYSVVHNQSDSHDKLCCIVKYRIQRDKGTQRGISRQEEKSGRTQKRDNGNSTTARIKRGRCKATACAIRGVNLNRSSARTRQQRRNTHTPLRRQKRIFPHHCGIQSVPFRDNNKKAQAHSRMTVMLLTSSPQW